MNNYFIYYLIFFFVLLVFSSFMVITSRNPIQSVLFLILVFLFSTIIFVFVGAEFIALLTLIIYVGAIAILFLFVIMLLNLRVVEIYSGYFNYLPIAGFITLFFLIILINLIINENNVILLLDTNNITYHNWISIYNYKTNLNLIGELLFNYFSIYFIIAAFILLVSMIGTIVLTLDNEIKTNNLSLNKKLEMDKKNVFFYLNEKKEIYYIKNKNERRS